MKTHLNVIQVDGGSNAELYSGARHDHVWNDDYTMFRAVPVRWWDDASYAAWQARDIVDDEDECDGGPGYCDGRALPQCEYSDSIPF